MTIVNFTFPRKVLTVKVLTVILAVVSGLFLFILFYSISLYFIHKLLLGDDVIYHKQPLMCRRRRGLLWRIGRILLGPYIRCWWIIFH
jgi:hypothetical protein